MTNDHQNILIIKPSAMGDIVHAMPVLAALRASLPQARISWLVRKDFAPLLGCVEGLDEILLFDRKQLGQWFYKPAAFKTLRTFMRTLKKNRYDLVLDLQGLFRTALFGRMTGCSKRIGMANHRELAGLFYTHQVQRPADSMHLLDYYHALLRQAGIEAAPVTTPLMNAPKEAVVSVREKLEQNGISKQGYFVLVPSSAHASKCWPADRFAQLAERLHQQFGLAAVVIGTEKDRAIIEAITAACSIPITNMMGKTTILELVALIQTAKAVVSNDTGPGHIAAVMHVPTVLIFGHTNPMRVGPYGRPECVAATEPDNRPRITESSDPKHLIKNVPLELVLKKITAQLEAVPFNDSN